MFGLLFVLAVTAPPAMPSASVTCPGWPASCDGAWAPDDVAAGTPTGGAANEDGPPEYATPVEIDCPTPPEAAPDDSSASGECSEPPLALFYRYFVSRTPESEAPTGSLAPAPRRARASHRLSARGAQDPAGHLSAPDLQPLALCALPGLMPGGASDLQPPSTRAIPARALAPPDRPPRA
jgi:hypothetical protein